jgi:membrane-bound serine protease (ClpP class)
MEEILINPNIAYLLLVFGFILAGLAILSPGTGILEIATLFVLFLAGWEIYNLDINIWALVFMLLGVVPYGLAIRKKGNRLYLILSLVMVVGGSWFLFKSDVWWQPAINPLLFIVASLILAGFIWVVTQKGIETGSIRPSHDPDALIGEDGEAKTMIYEEGSVQIAGELWTARSQKPIPKNARVRVTGRQGFVLEVEAIDSQGTSAPDENV